MPNQNPEQLTRDLYHNQSVYSNRFFLDAERFQPSIILCAKFKDYRTENGTSTYKSFFANQPACIVNELRSHHETKLIRLFALLALFLVPIFGNSQTMSDSTVTDSSIMYGFVSKNTYSNKSPNNISLDFSKEFLKNDVLFIYALLRSTASYDKEEYFGYFHHLDSGYIRKFEADVSPGFIEFLRENRESGIETRKTIARLSALSYYKKELEAERKRFEKYDKLGLVLTDKEYAHSDIGSQFGLALTFYNGFSKNIKYINFTVRPYNRVGDMTRDDFGKDKFAGEIIGPLESKTESTVTFDDMFWDDNHIINCLKITYLKITFMDSSIKEIYDVQNYLGENVTNSCK